MEYGCVAMQFGIPSQLVDFTSTETVGLLGTERGAQDGHLDFHTAPELCSQLVLWMMLTVVTGDVGR